MRIGQTIYNFFYKKTGTKLDTSTLLRYEKTISAQKAEIADMLHSIKDTELVKLISGRRDNWREKYEDKCKEVDEKQTLLDNIYKAYPEILTRKVLKDNVQLDKEGNLITN